MNHKGRLNRAAINLTNCAVAELEQGNLVTAFDMLSVASNFAYYGLRLHSQVESHDSSPFRFHWRDCTTAFSSNQNRHRYNHSMHENRSNNRNSNNNNGVRKISSAGHSCPEGSASFLFMKGLVVTTPETEDISNICPHGYAWVVWYNFALCNTLLGTLLGGQGKVLLDDALELYQIVQLRINCEPSSRHWKQLLQMGLLNNQACIYHDFFMNDAKTECLRKLASMVHSEINFVDINGRLGTDDDRMEDDGYIDNENGTVRSCTGKFLVNLQILGSPVVAPSA